MVPQDKSPGVFLSARENDAQDDALPQSGKRRRLNAGDIDLVVHHSDFDVLIPSHSRIGKFSGGR
ncbi:hypothetical protein AAFX91_21215, partial [Bradyrhizobium sp. 31Argb]|uniref:hypothetical protein n=1 Tax=Bradyrhizobium sp. 31Argb TaxID=3141247 RepID=UPI0037482D31